jgi:hypothetical protein
MIRLEPAHWRIVKFYFLFHRLSLFCMTVAIDCWIDSE